MKRFKCKVERVNEYIIEFDEEILNQEWLDEFSKHFYKFKGLEEHAEHIAQIRARTEQDFIEGYGIPLVNGKVPHFADKYNIEKGINIVIVSEDEDCEIDVEEII